MNSYQPDFYIRLGLDSSATEKDIKRAYARRLKTIDQATQAEAFLQLRQDYELALGYAKSNLEFDDFNQDELEVNTNEQLVNPKINQEDEAKQTQPSSEFHSNSTPELNSNSSSEQSSNNDTKPQLDIQQEFELKIKNKRKFYQETEPVVIPYDLMKEFIQEIKRSNTNETSLNDHAVLSLLKQYLAKDEFLNLEVNEYFEDFLAQQLVKLEFGIFNLPLLKIFADYFNWYDSSYQSGRGKALAHVNYIAYQIDKSSPAFLHALHRILQIPNKEQSATILKFYKELYIHNDDIINFCVPPEHMQQWMIAKKSQLFIFNWFELLHDQWNKINDRYKGVIFGLVSLLAVFFLTFVLTGIKRSPNTQEKFLNEIYTKCDAIYANAINKKWQGLSLFQASELHECANFYAPQVCESREQFVQVLSYARVLYPLKSTSIHTKETVNLNDVYLNSNGLHYEFDPQADCSSVHKFVTTMRWDLSLDEKALAKMIPIYQGCYENAMKEIASYNVPTDDIFPVGEFQNTSKKFYLFSNLLSDTIYKYFNNSIYSINAIGNKTGKLSSKQILASAKPIPILSELELRGNLFYENDLEVVVKKPYINPADRDDKFINWTRCIPLEKAKNLDQNGTQKVGPQERASIQKMLEMK